MAASKTGTEKGQGELVFSGQSEASAHRTTRACALDTEASLAPGGHAWAR